MTSQVIPPMPSAGLSFAPRSSGAGGTAAVTSESRAGVVGTWRHRSTFQNMVGLSWAVAISASFLVVGVVGLDEYVPRYHLKTLEDLADVNDAPMIETSMAELMSLQDAQEEVAEEVTELPVEITEVLETPQPLEDLPELVEAMTLEDIFAVPSAPRIEDALRPVDPVVKPRPRPTPTPNKPRSTVAKSSGTGSPNARPGAVGGTAGGSGMGRGSGKGRYPKPPYPSAARRAGMQGTVRLLIHFGPTGAVESVRVTGTSGYSVLDSGAEDYIRRYWRDPGKASQTVTVPIVYKLN